MKRVEELRRFAQTVMTCEAEVTEPSTEDVWDEDLGYYVPGPPTVVWSGPCLIYSRSLDGAKADAGGRTWQIDTYVVTFPAGTDVRAGQGLRITASPDEPDLTTFVLTLTDVPVEAWSVALQCLAQRVT